MTEIFTFGKHKDCIENFLVTSLFLAHQIIQYDNQYILIEKGGGLHILIVYKRKNSIVESIQYRVLSYRIYFYINFL